MPRKIQAGFGALQPYANEAPDNSSIYRARNFKLQLYHPLGDSDTGFPPEGNVKRPNRLIKLYHSRLRRS